MKLKNIIGCAAVATMAACGSAPQTEQGIGIDLANMDTTIAPGTDFYRYVCGTWIKNNPLTPEYARYGSFDVLQENNQAQLKELILGLAEQDNAPGSVAKKIADLYNMMMDSARQNEEGIKPIMSDYTDIAHVTTRETFMQLLTAYEKKGVQGLWGAYIGADIMNSKMNLVEMYQGGMSMGQKDYYVSDEPAFAKIREAFKQHVVRTFQLMGEDEATATDKMKAVMEIETAMARAAKSRVELRNPAENYNKMTYADFKEEYKGFDWDAYYAASYMEGIDSISIGQPASLRQALDILNGAPIEKLQSWLQWQLVDGNASYLGDEMFNENFDFYSRTMNGQQQPKPRWKRSVAAVEGVLGEAVGQMYVEKYFPAQNKERMEQLVKNLQYALAERIDAQEWMSDSTKLVAKEKLDAFRVKVGYPDKWIDYSTLAIEPDWNLYVTMQIVRDWAVRDQVNRKFKKPVDPTEWHMTPQTVNAYYNPTTNEICFPAGILQPPFFDMAADDAFNYGAIGVVIGHEMTHGFDDQGRQFDKDGNLREWWQAGDAEKFTVQADRMIDYFNKIEVLPGLMGNGPLTVGENLADHGGLQVAYTALQKAMQASPANTVEGFTPEQRFFMAYANVWAQNITEEAIRQRTASDPHSLGEWRVNGALPHIDAWYEAFGIKEGDPLYVAPEDRVRIW